MGSLPFGLVVKLTEPREEGEHVVILNGTVVISTEGADDLDMNEFPPVGITVVTTNDTITVTYHTVTIGGGIGNPGSNNCDDGGEDEGDEDDEE